MKKTLDELEILDYVDYLDTVESITIFPNNDIEEAGDNLEGEGFSISDVLANAKNYHLYDDVLWINTTTHTFGTWPMWEMESLFGEKALAWVNEQEG